MKISLIVLLGCLALAQCWEQNWRQNWWQNYNGNWDNNYNGNWDNNYNGNYMRNWGNNWYGNWGNIGNWYGNWGNNWGNNWNGNWYGNWGNNWNSNYDNNWDGNNYWGQYYGRNWDGNWYGNQYWRQYWGGNWDGDWENWGQNRFSRCYAIQRECMEMMRPAMYLNEYRYVYNGQLSVPCGQELQAAESCFERSQQYGCDWDYNSMFGYTFMTWNYMCDNRDGFMSGESCWGSDDFYNGMSQCNQGQMWSNDFDMCEYSRCMRYNEFPSSNSCSRENWQFWGQMGEYYWNRMSCRGNNMF